MAYVLKGKHVFKAYKYHETSDGKDFYGLSADELERAAASYKLKLPSVFGSGGGGGGDLEHERSVQNTYNRQQQGNANDDDDDQLLELQHLT